MKRVKASNSHQSGYPEDHNVNRRIQKYQDELA